jgi:hypothetical protein
MASSSRSQPTPRTKLPESQWHQYRDNSIPESSSPPEPAPRHLDNDVKDLDKGKNVPGLVKRPPGSGNPGDNDPDDHHQFQMDVNDQLAEILSAIRWPLAEGPKLKGTSLDEYFLSLEGHFSIANIRDTDTKLSFLVLGLQAGDLPGQQLLAIQDFIISLQSQGGLTYSDIIKKVRSALAAIDKTLNYTPEAKYLSFMRGQAVPASWNALKN